jgi:hypothetical protein
MNNESRCATVIQNRAKQYMCSNLNGTHIHRVECTICMDDQHWGVRLPCNHSFHFACISKWLRCENSCPLCRKHTINTKIKKIQQYQTKIRNILELPIETLLNFPSALHYSFFNNICKEFLENLETYIRRLNNNSDIVQTLTLNHINAKFKHLNDIKRLVGEFDSIQLTQNTITETNILHILTRLNLPFHQLYLRVKDVHIELKHLRYNLTFECNGIRKKLCLLFQLEQKIEEFNGISFQSQNNVRSFIPLSFRTGSLVAMQAQTEN